MAKSHLDLIDIMVSMARKNANLWRAIAVLGESEYRQVASLALCKAVDRYDDKKGTFSTYAFCTMIPHVTDAAKRFVRFRDAKRTSYKSIPVIVPIDFSRFGGDEGGHTEKAFVPTPVQSVFKTTLDDDEVAILRWACQVIPGVPGEILRQSFLGSRQLKDVGAQFGVSVQNAWHARSTALESLRLLVEYTPEGCLVRVPRLDCSPEVGAGLVASVLRERGWRQASWVNLLEETELTPEALGASLNYSDWFRVTTRGLYWMDDRRKDLFRGKTARRLAGRVRDGNGE